jgi:hypothetical protein
MNRLFRWKLCCDKGGGVARRWEWRGDGSGEEMGVARRWEWRGDGSGEEMGVARRWEWRGEWEWRGVEK